MQKLFIAEGSGVSFWGKFGEEHDKRLRHESNVQKDVRTRGNAGVPDQNGGDTAGKSFQNTWLGLAHRSSSDEAMAGCDTFVHFHLYGKTGIIALQPCGHSAHYIGKSHLPPGSILSLRSTGITGTRPLKTSTCFK
jgi:hypothetical protein